MAHHCMEIAGPPEDPSLHRYGTHRFSLADISFERLARKNVAPGSKQITAQGSRRERDVPGNIVMKRL